MRNVPNAKGTKFCWKAVEDVENKPKVNKLLKNVGRCQKRAEWFQTIAKVTKNLWKIGRSVKNVRNDTKLSLRCKIFMKDRERCQKRAEWF